MMTLTVNGDPHPCVDGLTIEALLREKTYTFPLKVVIVNGQVVQKTRLASTVLNDGDVVEVVHLIGGG
jgi:sulfur carrier protein